MATGRILAAALIGLVWPITSVLADDTATVTYDTEQAGPLTLVFAKDNTVTGTYPKYDGKLKGTLKGADRVEGMWWQTKGFSDDVKCDKEMNGTSYWGKFVLLEDADQKGFHGMWGSCDEEPSDAWTGKIKS